MLQKKVKKRATLLIALTLISLLAIFFILMGLNKNILYFKSPTDIKTNEDINFNKKIRVGGMVKKNSLVIEEKEIKFIITDFQNELQISFSGTVPNLFSEGKGVVAEGKLQDKKFFIADRILVLKKGEIVELNTAEKIFKSPKNTYTKKLISALDF